MKCDSTNNNLFHKKKKGYQNLFLNFLVLCFLLEVAGAQEKFTLLSATTSRFNNRGASSNRTIPAARTTLARTTLRTTSPLTTTTLKTTTTRTTTVKPPSSTKVPYRKLVCPSKIRIPLFSLPCQTEKDCRIFGPNLACCQQRCIKGVWVPQHSKRTARISNAISSNEIKPLETSTSAVKGKKDSLVCPSKDVRLPFFSLPCKTIDDCKIFGRNLLCCRSSCVQGVYPPKEEVNHAPTLFGLVDRMCPAQPLAEILDVKECHSDSDCTPRICCPEKNTTTRKSYCRTPIHKLDRLPGAKRIEEPLRNFVSYMQCTPKPPTELFPKPCNNTLDCFPNLCCLENGKKHCRPPRRSIISWVADVGTKVGAVEATKKFIERITN